MNDVLTPKGVGLIEQFFICPSSKPADLEGLAISMTTNELGYVMDELNLKNGPKTKKDIIERELAIRNAPEKILTKNWMPNWLAKEWDDTCNVFKNARRCKDEKICAGR